MFSRGLGRDASTSFSWWTTCDDPLLTWSCLDELLNETVAQRPCVGQVAADVVESLGAVLRHSLLSWQGLFVSITLRFGHLLQHPPARFSQNLRDFEVSSVSERTLQLCMPVARPLAALQGEWRASGGFVDVRLIQLFTREFQAGFEQWRVHKHLLNHSIWRVDCRLRYPGPGASRHSPEGARD